MLDDAHLPMAMRAMGLLQLIRSFQGMGGLMQKGSTEWKQVSSSPICKPAEIANTGQALGQSVLQEAEQKLLAGKSLRALLIVMSIILPSESHVRLVNRDDSMIGNSNPMRVAGEILQDVFGATEWRFGIDDPILFR